MSNKNLAQAGEKTRFSKESQPANPGRRPSVLSKYIRENRVSLSDIQALISSLVGYNADEIQDILKDKNNKPPVGIICILKALMADMDSGAIGNLMTLMDRAYGKPDKTVNHEINAIAPETLAMLRAVFLGEDGGGEGKEQKPAPGRGGEKARGKTR